MKTLALFLLCVLMAGCSTLDPQPVDESGLRLENKLDGQTILFLALTTEMATLIDISPELGVEGHEHRLVAPGETVAIEEIDGDYRFGDDVTLLIYVVSKVHLTRAGFLTHLNRTHEELLSDDFLVSISSVSIEN